MKSKAARALLMVALAKLKKGNFEALAGLAETVKPDHFNCLSEGYYSIYS